MSNNEMEVRIQKLLEWEALAEEAKAEADMIRDEIKCCTFFDETMAQIFLHCFDIIPTLKGE